MKKGFFIRYIKPIVVVVIGLLVLIGLSVAFFQKEEKEQSALGRYGAGQIPQAVLQYQPLIEEELKKYGLEEHIHVLLAITTQESGGVGSLDVMQSSESLGLPPNTIQDPLYSIEVGVKYFAEVMAEAEQSNVDTDTAIQAYNMGNGFIPFVAENGGVFTTELAQQFSNQMKAKTGWIVYGDPNYVANVKQYMGSSEGTTVVVTGELADFQKMFEQYEGMPYVFGGASPSTSFDCSGLWYYLFPKIGVNVPRTAQAQYDFSKKVTEDELQAGDLVFFHSTYDSPDYITHVGMYMGNGLMFNAGDPLKYADIHSTYWEPHIAGYGRIVDFKA
ncbi:bifunctional lysozyme/C40 family peptidase (plasmid) [Jeotgalibaca sp. MA1X17-3]|uniref:bifunctional lytic transglycosylase/C40 family peptidase n=1 Tax=Jeotgalibaca sp. MA1X17-3 TaxID=2908211 RepID=UPI001F24C6DE|nr:bifunctional lytic transglycosylase/C40 family peptidase [Jeotgalibaca sp. MA1X17-3]UJF16797.1 bifunctional lysozyme/C40 family peptidase [Jeotgalibaca sp. MA1X17-3]